MSKRALIQLKKLSNQRYSVNNSSNSLDEYFTEVVFNKKGNDNDGNNGMVKIVFEDYIITPFNGFDFHDKWNNGVAPYSRVMYGKIVQETKGMYKFEAHSESSDKEWVGWCPKKSCTIKYM